MRLALALLLAGLAALPAGAEEVDFSELYGSPRDQCRTGSCHAFASVALLEAAHRRRRRDAEPLALSDADLFLQANVIEGAYEPRGRGPRPVLMERLLVEGGFPHRDLALALERGVALEETVPWGPFLRRFEEFRARRRAEFAAAARAAGTEADPADSEALLAWEEGLTPSRERRRAEEAFFYDDSARLAADRQRVKALLAGFSVHRSTFGSVVPGPGDAQACRRRGEPVKRRLKEDFGARRPALICLRLDGLEEWGQEARANARHCVAVAGYRSDAERRMTLFTRNSWGRWTHPDVPEEQFCRVFEVVSLRP